MSSQVPVSPQVSLDVDPGLMGEGETEIALTGQVLSLAEFCDLGQTT